MSWSPLVWVLLLSFGMIFSNIGCIALIFVGHIAVLERRSDFGGVLQFTTT